MPILPPTPCHRKKKGTLWRAREDRAAWRRRAQPTGGGGAGDGGGTPLQRLHDIGQIRATLALWHLPRLTLRSHLLVLRMSTQLELTPGPPVPIGAHGTRSLSQIPRGFRGMHVPSHGLKQLFPVTRLAPLTIRLHTSMH